jgi:hypothetical protein
MKGPQQEEVEEGKASQVVDSDEVPSSSPAKGIVVGSAKGDVDMEGGLQHLGGYTVSQRAVTNIGNFSEMVGTIPYSISDNHAFIPCIHLLIYPQQQS